MFSKFITKFELNKKKLELDYSNIYFADLETHLHNNKHYTTTCCIYAKHKKINKNKSINISEYSYVRVLENISNENIAIESNNLLENFIDTCFTLKHRSYIYFHNLSKFDGILILNYLIKSKKYTTKIIDRNNVIYEIKIYNKNNKLIYLRDSYLLFPMSLTKFAKTFNIDNKLVEKKENYNHNGINIENYSNKEFVKELSEYCLDDCKILAECYYKFSNYIFTEFDIDPIKTLSFSSLAFRIFRTHYYDKPIIFKSKGSIDKFIRKSYKGGVSNVYKPLMDIGYYYDVNSLYPYIMKTFPMPVGEPEFVLMDASFDITNFYGFIECEVECPKDMYIPFLCIHTKDGLLSPSGFFKGVFHSEEIKYALTLGYTIKYIRGQRFNSEIIFDKFVNDLYEKRRENKEKNPALSHIMKLLLNSLYGRFGMRHEKSKTAIINLNCQKDVEFYKKHLINSRSYEINSDIIILKYDDITSIDEIKDQLRNNEISIDEYNELLMKLDKKNDQDINIAVQISSSITAYARIYMHKFLIKHAKYIRYSDTDSLVTTLKMEHYETSDSIIGLFKLESEIINGIFIASKAYLITLNDGTIKIIFKGANSKKLTKDDFTLLYNEEAVTIEEINLFKRDQHTYEVRSVTTQKTFSSVSSNKREKVYINDEWVDTKPIHLEKK